MGNRVTMTRRQFLKLSGITAAAFMIGFDFLGKAEDAVQDFLKKRLNSVYANYDRFLADPAGNKNINEICGDPRYRKLLYDDEVR